MAYLVANPHGIPATGADGERIRILQHEDVDYFEGDTFDAPIKPEVLAWLLQEGVLVDVAADKTGARKPASGAVAGDPVDSVQDVAPPAGGAA